jgi:hypothetical protein
MADRGFRPLPEARRLLALHGANFRFCDTRVAQDFDVVLEADPVQLAPDVLFDRNDTLMSGARYRAVAFEKRCRDQAVVLARMTGCRSA